MTIRRFRFTLPVKSVKRNDFCQKWDANVAEKEIYSWSYETKEANKEQTLRPADLYAFEKYFKISSQKTSQ